MDSGLLQFKRTGSAEIRTLSRRLIPMQALKFVVLGALLFVLIRYAPVYYHTSEFSNYVEQQVAHSRAKGALKDAILRNAAQNSLPVTSQNINITTRDSVLRVEIEYQVPLDLFFFQKLLTFRAAGSGFAMNN
jgi:hypothetical protein